MDRSLALLGMAKKAGRLAIGSQAVASAARRGEAKLIITANDASEASVRRAKSNAETNGVSYAAVPYTMFELGRSAGRGSPGTIAFLDKGLAAGFLERLAELLPDKPDDRKPDKLTNRRSDKTEGRRADKPPDKRSGKPVASRRISRRSEKSKESDA